MWRGSNVPKKNRVSVVLTMTTQIPESSKITLSPKKKTEKVLPMNNPQNPNTSNNASSVTENQKMSSGMFNSI